MKGDYEKYGIKCEFYSDMKVGEVPYREFIENNELNPWYLKFKKIDQNKFETWFPSLPITMPFGAKIENEIISLDKFKLIEQFPGTGATRQIYQYKN